MQFLLRASCSCAIAHGVAPGVSPIRTAWIAVFLVPEEFWWSHGESHPDLRNAIALSCS